MLDHLYAELVEHQVQHQTSRLRHDNTQVHQGRKQRPVHYPAVILGICVLLLEEVKGQDGRDHEEERDCRVENGEDAFELGVVRVENDEALVIFEVHLEQLLERDGQQNARDGY